MLIRVFLWCIGLNGFLGREVGLQWSRMSKIFVCDHSGSIRMVLIGNCARREVNVRAMFVKKCLKLIGHSCQLVPHQSQPGNGPGCMLKAKLARLFACNPQTDSSYPNSKQLYTTPLASLFSLFLFLSSSPFLGRVLHLSLFMSRT